MLGTKSSFWSVVVLSLIMLLAFRTKADVLLDEHFDTDVIASGSWLASDASVSVDVGNGWLRIGNNGVHNDFAEKLGPFPLPIVIEFRLRTFDGEGSFYSLPKLEFWWGASASESCHITYVQDDLSGNPADDGWLICSWSDTHTLGTTDWDQWRSVKAIIRNDGGELYAKLDGDIDFTPVFSTTWTIPDVIERIRLSQHSDNVSDFDYVRVTSLPSCTTIYTFTGEAADDALGWSVSGAGDVDGDGYDDIVVGATRSDAGGSQSGKVYVYSGKSGATLFEITGEQAGNELGGATGGIGSGDFNGDGYDDIIMGARFHNGIGSNSGRAYLFLGRPGPYPVLTGASNADMIISGESTGDRLGYSTSSAGDVNGDGYDDFIIGATQDYSGGSAVGRAYVFFGGTGVFPSVVFASAADLTLIGEAPGHFFGLSVSGAGDFNSDGFDDMIVGAPQQASGGTGGKAYIFLGGSGPFPKSVSAYDADVIITGESSGDFFGVSTSFAGDINADGYADVIVGASYNDAGGTDAGRAYVFFGSSGTFPHTNSGAGADIIFTGELANAWFGSNVSGTGDVNCDGLTDLLISAPPWDFALVNDVGRTYLFLGGIGAYPASIAASSADLVFSGEGEGDLFGASISGVGDVNGDGCNDFIIGTPKNDFGGADAGRAYVYSCAPITHKCLFLDSREMWQNSGVFVNVGDNLTITAEGLITVSTPGFGLTYDPDGCIQEQLPDCNTTPNGPLALCGNSPVADCLVGRIGDQGACFFVGSNFSDIINEGGFLWLAFNDAIDAFHDNFGSFNVCVQLTKQDLITVPSDIKPRSCPNPLSVNASNQLPDEVDTTQSPLAKVNPDSPLRPRAVIPVAILGTADFDVSDINPSTVTLAGVPATRWNYEDVSTPVDENAAECECNNLGGDAYVDLTLKFDREDIIDSLGVVSDGEVIPLTITGQLNNGTHFEGTDCVLILGNTTEEVATASLIGNFPNPFNPSTNISFSLPVKSRVKLEVYNIIGRKVVTLLDDMLNAGEHLVEWDGRDKNGQVAASGIYFYRLVTDESVSSKKMMLLK